MKISHELCADVLSSYSLYMADSMFVKDREGRFVFVNHAKAANSKTTPENMIGKTDYDFMTKEEADRARSDELNVMDSLVCLKNKEEKITRVDSTVSWVSVTKCPHLDSKGNCIGIIGIARNITKQIEAEMAKDKAELHNHLVTHLLKHDLRNYIIATVDEINMVIKGNFTDINVALKKIKKKVIGTEKIINDCVLIDENQSKTKEVDLSDIVDSVLVEFQQEFENKNIKIDNSLGGIPRDEISLEAEAHIISLIKSGLRQFISNFIRYAGENFTFAIGREKNDGFVKIIVYNSGTPIPDEVVRRLFEQGYSGGGKGSGVGLYLIRESIRNFGGDVWYEPAWNNNTQFIIRLPI
jgi:PAS domain S-box-containing protein